MWGRAGRRGRGLAVYIAGEDALDQFFCRHPDEFLGPPGRGGDPRPGSPRDLSPSTCCAPRTRRRSATRMRSSSGRSGASYASELADAGLPARARHRVRAQARRRLPGRAGRAALGLGRQLRADRRELRRGARDDRGRRAPTRPSTRARCTCTSAAPTRCASSTSTARRALLEPFDGDYFTQTKRESMTYIERAARAARDARRDALVRRGRLLRDGPRLPAQGPAGPRGDRLPDARLPTVEFPTRALWYELDELIAARAVPARASCSGRCTRSSTVRSRCCR